MAAPTKYQEVITATNYALTAEDGTPFPVFLRFDGTDDSMATNSIDFSGTAQMSVFAGFRVNGIFAYPTVAELSASADANNYTFNLMGYNNGSTNYFLATWRSTIAHNVNTEAIFAPPYTAIAATYADFSVTPQTAAIKANGRSPVTATIAGTAGNFGNYPLYIGRRGGTLYPLNGRLYSLIVVGKLASAAEITATEAYINNRTRAY